MKMLKASSFFKLFLQQAFLLFTWNDIDSTEAKISKFSECSGHGVYSTVKPLSWLLEESSSFFSDKVCQKSK